MEDAGAQNESQDLDNTLINAQSTPAPNPSKTYHRAPGEVVSGVAQLRTELRSFKRTIEDRLHKDLLTFARHEEALDTATRLI